ncbi:MAG: cell division protein ZapA [Enterococcus sp.]
MVQEKKRYKAVIAGEAYTIIGQESKRHMDMVVALVNDQLEEIKQLSPEINAEQASILMAINAISDQLKKQEQILKLEKQVEELKEKTVKFTELETRVKRIEAVEDEAREILKESGQKDVEIKNHVEAQQIINEKNKSVIKHKASK